MITKFGKHLLRTYKAAAERLESAQTRRMAGATLERLRRVPIEALTPRSRSRRRPMSRLKKAQVVRSGDKRRFDSRLRP